MASRAFLMQLAVRYKHKGAFALFHVNDFGAGGSPEKARQAKVMNLNLTDIGVANSRRFAKRDRSRFATRTARLHHDFGHDHPISDTPR